MHAQQPILDSHLHGSTLAFRILVVTKAQQNCSLVWCRVTKQAAIVDPGGDIGKIQGAIRTQGVELSKILITHGHVDHGGGASQLSELLGVPIEGPHRGDESLIEGMERQTRRATIQGEVFIPER